MSEQLGPEPADIGQDPHSLGLPEAESTTADLETEQPTAADFCSQLATKLETERAVVGREWPEPWRDLKDYDGNLKGDLPETYDPNIGLERGRQFLAFLAEDRDHLYQHMMCPNENWRSLSALISDLSEIELALMTNVEGYLDLVITAKELRAGGNRGEIDYPHHLSISGHDLTKLGEKLKQIHLFVQTLDESGEEMAELVTLDLSGLGLVNEQGKSTGTLVVPFDYFCNSEPQKGRELNLSGKTDVPADEGPPGITNYPESEQAERVAELVNACKEYLEEEEIASLSESVDWDEAISDACTLLIEKGVADPEEYLKEKGVLE